MVWRILSIYGKIKSKGVIAMKKFLKVFLLVLVLGLTSFSFVACADNPSYSGEIVLPDNKQEPSEDNEDNSEITDLAQVDKFLLENTGKIKEILYENSYFQSQEDFLVSYTSNYAKVTCKAKQNLTIENFGLINSFLNTRLDSEIINKITTEIDENFYIVILTK